MNATMLVGSLKSFWENEILISPKELILTGREGESEEYTLKILWASLKNALTKWIQYLQFLSQKEWNNYKPRIRGELFKASFFYSSMSHSLRLLSVLKQLNQDRNKLAGAAFMEERRQQSLGEYWNQNFIKLVWCLGTTSFTGEYSTRQTKWAWCVSFPVRFPWTSSRVQQAGAHTVKLIQSEKTSAHPSSSPRNMPKSTQVKLPPSARNRRFKFVLQLLWGQIFCQAKINIYLFDVFLLCTMGWGGVWLMCWGFQASASACSFNSSWVQVNMSGSACDLCIFTSLTPKTPHLDDGNQVLKFS